MTYPIRNEAAAVHDEVIYRCIHAACARPLPRRVNFCPYCGTGQHADADNPAHVVPIGAAVRNVGPQAGASVQAAPSVAVEAVPSAPPPEPATARAGQSAGSMPSSTTPAGGSANAPRVSAAAPPPRREPVRLRYWLLALGLLWAIWITAKPSSKKIDARIDQAIALAANCKFNEAQSELIALRSANASPEQLQHLQAALNDAVPACDKRRAWPKASKREGSNPRAEDVVPPAASMPARSSMALGAARQVQSARNLVAEADRALAQGNYKAAADKMETCIAMVDAGNRECIATKLRAERLQREMLRCVAEGSDWVNDRCQ